MPTKSENELWKIASLLAQYGFLPVEDSPILGPPSPPLAPSLKTAGFDFRGSRNQVERGKRREGKGRDRLQSCMGDTRFISGKEL